MNVHFRMLLVIPILCLLVLSGCAPKATPGPTPTAVPTPPTDDLEASARYFTGLLADGKYAQAYSMFDPQMAAALPVAKLKATWDEVVRNVGELKGITGVALAEKSGYRVAYVACDFARTPLDMQLTFDREGRIAGMFFLPAGSGGTWKAPDYADATAFTETETQIGGGFCTLPATLTMPAGQGPFPAVVLVHGSGPNDRDESIGPNKPFNDLAWGLAAQGIAVLRYEKRTKQCAAEVILAMDTLTLNEETVDDAVAAAAYLRTVDGIAPNRVFILGHSLGGMAAPRIGAQDSQLAGLILLAASARPLTVLMLEQTEYLASLDGKVDDAEAKALAELREQVGKVEALNFAPGETILGAAKAYWADILAYDPVATARSLNIPMLILQGERDYQVTMEDFAAWKAGLAGRTDVQFKSYPSLNHLFIAGSGQPNPDEYYVPGNVDQVVVEDIAPWVKGK
jgi:hypothetical protein